MRKVLCLLLLTGLTVLVSAARADDSTRNLQIQLKNRGFYYGQVDGVSGPETEAAVRRFQIRNGLGVTGTLTDETAGALNRPPSASAPPPPGTENLRTKPDEFRETDQQFLQENPRPSSPAPTPAPTPAPSRARALDQEREERYGTREEIYRAEPFENEEDRPGFVPPPVTIPSPYGPDLYADLLLGTIYEEAPRQVQRDLVRDAQYRLARLRYYNGELDGIPGPATEEALAQYQDDGGRRVTGRLDMATLNDLGLLSRRRGTTLRFGIEFGGNRVYRGVEISR